MAKGNKENLQLDDNFYDPSMDFNFDDVGMGEFSPESKSKKRTPVMDAFRGVTSGAKKELGSRQFLRDTVEKSLPRQYGSVLRGVDSAAKNAGALYDDAIREVKPAAASLARKIDKLVPVEDGILRRSMNRIKRQLDIRDDDGSSNPSVSAEDAGAAAAMAVLGAQQEIEQHKEARRNAKEAVAESINRKRWGDQLSALNAIDRNISRLTQYNDKVTQAYQRKSLELQFRSYFGIRELVNESRRYFQIHVKQTEDLLRNTALPEFVKITNSERFKDIARNKLIDSVQTGFFGGTDLIERASKRLRNQAKGFFSQLKMNSEMAGDGIDQIQQLKEMNQALVDAGMPPLSKEEMAGMYAGGEVTKWFRDKVTDRIYEFTNQHKEISKRGYKAATMLRNGDAYLNDGRLKDASRKIRKEDKWYSEKGAAVVDWFANLIRPESESKQVSNGNHLDDLDGPAAGGMTNKANISLTEVIPGLLSMIHNEQVMTRTGASASPMMYDYTKRKFISRKDMADRTRSGIEKAISSSSLDYRSRAAMRTFTGDANFDSETEAEIKRALMIMSRDTMKFDEESIRGHDAYKNLSRKSRKAFGAHLRKRYRDDADEAEYKATDSMLELRAATPGVREVINKLVNAGYGEALEEARLVVQREDGGYDVNEDEYLRMVDKNGIIKSDRNVKTDIQKFSPKSALSRLKKMPVFSWKYKDKNKEGGGTKIGPMAQDVNKQAGNKAAPNGTSIDTVTMNGMAISAIQELSNEQSKFKKDQNFLRQIAINTGRTVKILEDSSLFGLKGKGAINGVIDYAKKGISAAPGRIASGYRFMRDKVGDPITKFLGDLYRNNKDWAKDKAKAALESLYDFGKSALDKAKTVMFDIIPDGLSRAKNFAFKQLGRAKEAMERLGDVYVKGKVEPVLRAELIKAGFYYDRESKKVIQKLSDIKGAVVDPEGNLILSVEDIKGGLYDRFGAPLRDLGSEVVTYIKNGFGRALNMGRKIKNWATDTFNGWRNDRKGKDADGVSLGLVGNNSTLLAIQAILETHLGSADPEIFKRIKDSYDKASLTGFAKNAISSAKSLFNNAVSAAKGGSDDSKKQGIQEQPGDVERPDQARIGDAGGLGRIGGKLMRGLGGLFGGPGALAAAGEGATAGRSSFFKKLSGLFGSAGGNPAVMQELPMGPQEPGWLRRMQTPGYGQQDGGMMSKAKDMLAKGKAAWNDSNGDGERDGGWRGKLANMTNRNKKDFVKASTDPRYKSADPIGNIMGMASGLMDMFGKKGGGILDTAGDLLGQAGDAMGIDVDLKGKGGKAKLRAKGLFGTLKNKVGALFGKKGVLEGAEAVGEAAAKKGILGKTAQGVVGWGKLAGRGVMGVAKGGMWALRGALGLGMMTMSGLATAATTVASAGMAAGSMLVGALLSPPVLGAAAIAAAAYGTYKLYKYFTEDNVNSYQEIRIKQYGLTNSEADKHHNHEILNLEAYLLDGRIGYNNNIPFIIPERVKEEELAGIFSIDQGDTEGMSKLSSWMESRFKPFFLTHVAALFSINPKLNLRDVTKLTEEESKKFLALVGYESGPYNYVQSPFKDIPRLNGDKTMALACIKNLLAENATKAAKAKMDKEIGRSDRSAQIEDARRQREDYAASKDSKAANDSKPTMLDEAWKGTKSIAKSTLGFLTFGYSDKWFSESGDDKPRAGSIPSNSPVAPGKIAYAGGPLASGGGGYSYLVIQPGVKFDTINPEFKKLFLGMAEEYGNKTGKKILVKDGYRSFEDQVAAAQRNPRNAAQPGRSPHEYGLAIDADSNALNECEKLGLMCKYGLTRPIGGELWHVEPAGIQTDIERAKRDPAWASMVIPMGRGRGGGGYATVSGARVRGRDNKLAVALLGLQNAPNIAFDSPQDVKPQDSRHFEDNRKTQQSRSAAARSTTMDQLMANSRNVGTIGAVNAAKERPVYQSGTRSSGAVGPLPPGPGMGGGSKVVPVPKNRAEVKQRIEAAARKAGGDPNLLSAFAAVESGMDPNSSSKTSSASGLFQFLSGTWNGVVAKHGRKFGFDGSESPTDLEPSTFMAAKYIEDNSKVLSSVKRDTNLTDAYLAHFLGPYGAKKILLALQRNPDASAAAIMPKAAGSNPDLFYSNGRPLTVSQFYNNISKRLQSKAAQYGVNINAGSFNGGSTGSSNNVDSGSRVSGIMTADLKTPRDQPYRQDNNGQRVQSRPVTSSNSGGSFGGGSYSSGVDSGARLGSDSVGRASMDTTNNILREQLSVLREISANLTQRNGSSGGGQSDSMTEAKAASGNTFEKPSPMPAPTIDIGRKA